MNTPELPETLSHLREAAWHNITIGRSSASVWRLHHAGQDLILKRDAAAPTSEMPGEADRLAWLASIDIPAPRLIAFESTAQDHWLLMSLVAGHDLTALPVQPEVLCTLLAGGLRQLHDRPVDKCPFDHRIESRLAMGTKNIEAGLVDEDDFDDERSGWSAAEVLDWLIAHRIDDDDLVVAHGDASIPNLMATENGFTGFVDCGRVGVADRWQDLAIACRSVAYNCGDQHIATFLRAYGADWDESRYRYFTTLDELF